MSEFRQEKHLITTPFLPFILHDETLFMKGIYTHWHENIEVLHCLEGSGIIQLDADSLEIHEGETVIVNSRCLHAIRTDDKIRYLCLIVDNEFFKSNGIKIDSLIFDIKFTDVEANELMKNIWKVFEHKNEMFEKAEKRQSILTFILHLCKMHSRIRKEEAEHNSKAYAAVLDAVEYINVNFIQRITIEELSNMFNYSKYHFSRLFKENTGLTIIDHINKRRCEHARLLLRDTQKPVSQICYECGFDTPSYFTKEFKLQYGLLPSDYRKEFISK